MAELISIAILISVALPLFGLTTLVAMMSGPARFAVVATMLLMIAAATHPPSDFDL